MIVQAGKAAHVQEGGPAKNGWVPATRRAGTPDGSPRPAGPDGQTQRRPLAATLRTVTFAGAVCLAAMLLVQSTPARAERVPSLELVDRYASSAQMLVSRGMEYLGVRYRRGGTTPETGLDCSGLVQNLFRNVFGLDLPRTAREMAALGRKVGYPDLEPGDLVFFNTMRRTFSHVGIYVGDGRFLHAPASGGRVRVEDMAKPYWTARFNGARRLLPQEAAEQQHAFD